jgi:hypothetical protein
MSLTEKAPALPPSRLKQALPAAAGGAVGLLGGQLPAGEPHGVPADGAGDPEGLAEALPLVVPQRAFLVHSYILSARGRAI